MKLFTAEHITPDVIAKELQANLLLSSPGGISNIHHFAPAPARWSWRASHDFAAPLA